MEGDLRATINSIARSILLISTFTLIIIYDLVSLTVEGILAYIIAINMILALLLLIFLKLVGRCNWILVFLCRPLSSDPIANTMRSILTKMSRSLLKIKSRDRV